MVMMMMMMVMILIDVDRTPPSIFTRYASLVNSYGGATSGFTGFYRVFIP
jgi:hypothetical protein